MSIDRFRTAPTFWEHKLRGNSVGKTCQLHRGKVKNSATEDERLTRAAYDR